MHEISIAMAIVEQIDDRSSDLGGSVRAVHLRVGVLSCVVPDALRFAWELAAEGTAAHGAELVIERVPLAIACDRCGEQTVRDGVIPICPGCGTPSREIVRGRELEISGVEVVDAEPVR